MDSYMEPDPEKTYISPSLPSFGNKDLKIRIASKTIVSNEGYEFAKIKDEIILRHKLDASTYITAKFFESSKEIFVLSIQKFSTQTGQPYGSGFSFIGDEIGKFIEFLANINSMGFNGNGPMKITDEELRKIVLTNNQASQLLNGNEGAISEALKTHVTKKDIISIAYRKKQLDTFNRLLNDEAFFEYAKKEKNCSNEALWQKFFEKNPWIFGYGLSYIYLSSLNDKKIEQVVQGAQIGQHGKRVDGLLKTRGAISNLCFVEIKTNTTGLLANTPYRSGCWAPSSELTGAVAQIQGTVSYAMDSIKSNLNLTDSYGDPTGEELFNFNPKSFLVVGNLSQFSSDNGINRDKLRSFENFRSNLIRPEVITFDELYERARFIVAFSENI
ncbi:Shedu immune nuclease family protein [Enterobacter cloacae]|uniref:Shedu immune nuclease family protein n=1 Tax=Enterobacter cloacae TaxID=550 RepID=UPI003AAA5C5F